MRFTGPYSAPYEGLLFMTNTNNAGVQVAYNRAISI